MSVLTVRGLRKSYGGVHAVRDVSFEVAAGEMVALIGPNGAGKTTCFNLINRQIAPDAGEVALEGRALGGLDARQVWRLGVGRTFQVTATFGSMSVRENVQTALLSAAGKSFSPFGLARKFSVGEADALLQRVGMGGQAERLCGTLAYGDLKRLELAMALAHRPKLLLMDEPTAGMAAEERDGLMSLAGELARAQSIAVLFTEHDVDVVFAYATRVLVLYAGEIIAQGPPQQVRADPRVQEVYLGPA